ncbi:hypothetical protein FACS1894188_02600 [Clostridia bacterium]|nr:hypothetical protein FACS1894188_02600 [Clostridia bacterium]
MIDYLERYIAIVTSIAYILIGYFYLGQSEGTILTTLIYIIVISYIVGIIVKFFVKKHIFIQEEITEEEILPPEEPGEDADLPLEEDPEAAGDPYPDEFDPANLYDAPDDDFSDDGAIDEIDKILGRR